MGNKWPDRIKPEEIKDLLQRIKDGDRSAKDRLIEGHIRLALSLANKFIKKFPQWEDALVSTAISTLVDKAERVEAGVLVDDNVGAYINSCVTFALRHLVANKIKEENRKLPKATEDIVYNEETYNLLLESIMKSSDFSDREKTLMSLRIEGFNDREIAEKFDPPISTQRVCIVRNNLRGKLEKFL